MDDMDAELARMLNPAALASAYAAELRWRRTCAGLTREQLAGLVRYPAAMIGMVEDGHRYPSRDFTVRCDAQLRTGGSLMRLLPSEVPNSYPSWFRDFVDLEATATAIQGLEVQVVPGLLQTEDYGRAVLANDRPPRTDAEIDRLLAARLDRQHILDRADPPLLSLIVTEAVLHLPVGGDAVLAAQLRHLLAAQDRPRLQLQVLPYRGAACCPTGGAFVLLDLPEQPRIAYTESLAASQMVGDADAVQKYASTFEAMRERALSPEDSADLITRALGER